MSAALVGLLVAAALLATSDAGSFGRFFAVGFCMQVTSEVEEVGLGPASGVAPDSQLSPHFPDQIPILREAPAS